jgi:hypothetical protein
MNASDKASQAFLYTQFNVNFGVQFSIKNQKKTRLMG